MAIPLLALTVTLSASLQIASAGWDRASAGSVGPRDSVRELRRARKAQNEFEVLRRWRAPRTFDRAPRPCDDQRIGRFCYWYGDTAETTPPKEPPQIGKARQKLLGTLASSARVISGDDWIVGQRLRYLVEDGDTSGAVRLASECRATEWWCDALRGFALHSARDYVAADAAFSDALRAMPEQERCRWTDLSTLLDGATSRKYAKLSCAERERENERLWWLSDPFHAVPGNDRRTEHYARLTMARMQEQAWNAHGIPWGDDMRELVVRYGWSTWWTRGEAPMHAPSSAPITGNSRTPAYHFVPEGELARDPAAAAGRAWPIEGLLRNGKTAREYYAPAYATSVSPLEHDAQLFRRGDSTLVVVTYDASPHAKLANVPLDAAIALSTGEGDEPIVTRVSGVRPAGGLLVAAPWRSMLMSVELLSPKAERAGRARRWIGDSTARLSGLLLVDAAKGLPSELEEAVARARPTSRLTPGDRLGLYWESYDVAPDDTLVVSIAVVREEASAMRRVAESLRLARQWSPVSLAWRETIVERRAVFGRSVALDLSPLSRGRYRIQLRVTRLGGETLAAERRIEIEDASR